MPRYSRGFDGERRTELIALKATPAEKRELEDAARLQGATRSTYARELLFRRSAAVVAATRRNPEAAALRDELRAIGNNINQIARSLNTTGELRDWQDLDATNDMLRAALARVIAL